MVPGSCVSTRERHWKVVVEKKNGRFGVVDGPRAVGFIDKFVFWPLVNVIQCASFIKTTQRGYHSGPKSLNLGPFAAPSLVG